LRRAPIVVTATVAGMVAVLNFKAHEPALPVAAASSSSGTSSGGAGASSGSSASSSKGGSSTGSSSSSSTSGTKVVTGNAQVRVTISNGKITKIEALQLQGNDPKSVQISSSAEPILQQSALQKQSAAIDTVSGATITSASYEASLQSALDKAGFKAADGSRGTSTVPDVPEEDHDGPGDRGGYGGDGGGVPPGFVPPQG
jgi:uncharacterized protein with FMN-binding domain